MNALVENAAYREDVLRELNLYPLWHLRVAVPFPDSSKVQLASSNEPTGEHLEEATAVAESLPVTMVIHKTPNADCSDLGWTELKKRVLACTACKLRAGCMQTVFGMGDEKSDWLFVGSWPTEDDETKGEPFAGQAGQLLDNMLAAIKLKRSEDVYLANIVKCSGAINRAPQADEIAQCSAYLTRQIQLLHPKLIVALGHAAATALLGEDREWDSLLGKVHNYIVVAKDGSQTAIPLIITHHPAALLLTPLNKAQTWQDLCLARDTMQRLLESVV